MKKLLFICAGLTFCTLFLWSITSAKAGSLPIEPAPAVAAKTGRRSLVKEEPVTAAFTAPASNPAAIAEKPAADVVLKEELPQPMLAFTFDDGPGGVYTTMLLDGLRERGVRVTFFMLGAQAKKSPEIVLAAYEDGHAIGGHGYDHRSYFTKLSTDSLKSQVQKTDDVITGITGGEAPLIIRPPYGAVNATVAKKTGKANILWSIDPRDWEVRDAGKIYTAIMERATDGGVVILHDIYEPSVKAALKAIDKLLEEGWRLVTVPELYADRGVTLQAGGIYRSPKNYTAPE